MTATETRRPGKPRTVTGKTADFVESRLNVAGPARRYLNKVFPDHWSFMMGEIALYSFIVLLLTGTYLSFFFDASMGEVRYSGSYVPLQGVEMSRAYASTLNISFDVRGGLVIRQIHHWAALLFVAAMLIHMLRIFFTGAFRKPREFNWIIGILLLVLGVLEGFVGYSLPDDLLSGTGLRIADAIILSIPIDPQLDVVPGVRRRLPWHIDRRTVPEHPRTRDPGHPGCAYRPAPRVDGAPEAHRLPRSGQDRAHRQRAPRLPDVLGQGGRVLLHRVRRSGGTGRPGTDQPDLAVRPVQPSAGLGRLAAGLVHGDARRFDTAVPCRGRSTICSVDIPSRRCSGPRWCCPAC